METSPTPTVISIDPTWFHHAYYVYFVTLIGKGKKMVYVGMTGDRAHLMARSPFYRMAGHFNQSPSTENQIIEGLRSAFSLTDRQQAELVAILEQLQITYYAYPLADFDFLVEKEAHTVLRRRGERTESWIIQQLQSDKTWELFNEKISTKPDVEAATIGALLLRDWRGRVQSII